MSSLPSRLANIVASNFAQPYHVFCPEIRIEERPFERGRGWMSPLLWMSKIEHSLRKWPVCRGTELGMRVHTVNVRWPGKVTDSIWFVRRVFSPSICKNNEVPIRQIKILRHEKCKIVWYHFWQISLAEDCSFIGNVTYPNMPYAKRLSWLISLQPSIFCDT